MFFVLYIGNEGSAFVEVLVGRSSSNDDYKVGKFKGCRNDSAKTLCKMCDRGRR